MEALQAANAPDARSVVTELGEADVLDEALTPGGEIVSEELIVQVIPQDEDEFTCFFWFAIARKMLEQAAGIRTVSSARTNASEATHEVSRQLPT